MINRMGIFAKILIVAGFLATSSPPTTEGARTLNIGCLFQQDRKEYLEEVANEAKKHYGNHGNYNYKIKFTFKDSGCNSTYGTGMGVELIYQEKVAALIG